jgi:hypothetical protein
MPNVVITRLMGINNTAPCPMRAYAYASTGVTIYSTFAPTPHNAWFDTAERTIHHFCKVVWTLKDGGGNIIDTRRGPLYEYVFLTAGNYSLQCDVTEWYGAKASGTATENFTIAAFSGTERYIAANGSDANPGTESQPWLTWNKAIEQAQIAIENQPAPVAYRLNFRRGDTFTVTSTSSYGGWGNCPGGPFVLGAYGSGADPIINVAPTSGGQTLLSFGAGASDVIFTNLRFIGQYTYPSTSPTANPIAVFTGEGCTRLTWKNCEISHFDGNTFGGVNISMDINAGSLTAGQLCFYDCTINHLMNSYGIAGQHNSFVNVNMTPTKATGQGGCPRVYHSKYLYLYNVTGTENQNTLFRINGPQDGIYPVEFAYIAKCTFAGEFGYNVQGADDFENYWDNMRDIVFEKSVIKQSPIGQASRLWIEARGVTVRNCIFGSEDVTPAPDPIPHLLFNVRQSGSGTRSFLASWQPGYQRVYNNTWLGRSTTGAGYFLNVGNVVFQGTRHIGAKWMQLDNNIALKLTSNPEFYNGIGLFNMGGSADPADWFTQDQWKLNRNIAEFPGGPGGALWCTYPSGGLAASLGFWQGASGEDANSSTSDPQLVAGPTIVDCQPINTAALAYHFGHHVDGLYEDFLEQDRHATTPSAGAYENPPGSQSPASAPSAPSEVHVIAGSVALSIPEIVSNIASSQVELVDGIATRIIIAPSAAAEVYVVVGDVKPVVVGTPIALDARALDAIVVGVQPSINPGDVFWVRAINAQGQYGPARSVRLNNPTYWRRVDAAGNPTTRVTRDENALAWPGARTNVLVVANNWLVLDNPASAGTYETPDIDFGALGNYRIGAIFWSSVYDSPTLNELAFSFNSTSGALWDFQGPINPATWFVNSAIEVKAADTTGNLATASYVPARTLDWYSIRYAKARVTIGTTNPSWLPVAKELYIQAEKF